MRDREREREREKIKRERGRESERERECVCSTCVRVKGSVFLFSGMPGSGDSLRCFCCQVDFARGSFSCKQRAKLTRLCPVRMLCHCMCVVRIVAGSVACGYCRTALSCATQHCASSVVRKTWGVRVGSGPTCKLWQRCPTVHVLQRHRTFLTNNACPGCCVL